MLLLTIGGIFGIPFFKKTFILVAMLFLSIYQGRFTNLPLRLPQKYTF